MRSKLLAITAFTPSSCVPLAAQSRESRCRIPRRRRRCVGTPSLLIVHRGVVDRHLLARRLVQRDAAFDPRAVGPRRHHQVLDAHVGEGAAHHHLVVAAARAVAVEVGDGHAVLLQVLAGGRRRLDRAGGRDVVGGDRVAEDAERARAARCRRAVRRAHAEVVEERRLRDVGRRRPVVDLAATRRRSSFHIGLALAKSP